jgi:DNA end-binding protein Ku
MAAKAIWTGVITFGMVSIPIRMFTATENKDISFNQLHATCKSRVREQRVCPTCDKKLETEEIEKGYAYGKDQYVVITKEDLDQIPLPSKGAIEISAFVKLDQIDPVQYEKSYYIEPDEVAKKPFTLFMRAMQEKGMVAIAKVSIRNKERLCSLRAMEGTLVMSTLLYPDEVRIERNKPLPDVALSDKELTMASSLIDLMAEDFDPSKYKDEYRESLMQVIEAKLEGKQLITVQAPPQSNVLELMDALRVSMETIKAKKAAAGSKPTPPTAIGKSAKQSTPARKKSSAASAG